MGKIFNDSPDECEMNKFDDMMALLQEKVPCFSQVVAVDRSFQLFTRIWCVAELVQAYLSDTPQRVCIFSSGVLQLDNEDHRMYAKLANMTIADCEASRPEDKQAILAKVPDQEEFDSQLQMMT